MTRPKTIGPSGHIETCETVHCRQFDDELLLLDLGAGEYFSLNAVGTRMWECLVDGKSPIDVAIELCGEYDVAEEVLVSDCVALANTLLERGLVKPRAP